METSRERWPTKLSLPPGRARRRSAPPWRDRAALLGIALGLIVLGACNGIVVEPIDQTAASGVVKFWGYAGTPNEQVRLEAQSTTWEQLGTAFSSLTPTYAGGYTGYYFEVSYNAVAIPSRFRKTSPVFGSWRSYFRISTPSGVAANRQYGQNFTQSTAESWMVRFWETHTIPNAGAIRIDIHP